MLNINGYSLLNYDIYSNRIGFFFNKREKIGSYYGLFLTTAYILTSLVLFFILLIKTLQRKDIKVYDSTVFSQDIPIIDINPDLIYFAFGLEDPTTSNRFVDETIYYAKIVFFDRKKENGEFNTTNRIELDYEVCKEENFGDNYQHLFIKGELNNSYCLKNYSLTLAGGYKYDRMSYFRIRIYPCKNKTENNNHCKPQEIIDNYFKGGYFSILTKDIGLNPSNYSFPVLSTLQDLYTTIDKNIYRDYILYFGITEIQTDIGLLFENIEIKRYINFRKETQSFYFRDDKEYYGGKATCSVAFRLDDLIKVQKRTYTKLKEVFASTGGYMQLISTICTLLSLLPNKLICELKIMNGIFNFNLKKQKMMMKIHSIKEFNSINLPQKNNSFIFFPTKNGIFNQKKHFSNKYSSLVGLENDNSSFAIGLNNNKEEYINNKGESGKKNNVTEDNSKISAFIDQRSKISKDKPIFKNSKINLYTSYIYPKSKGVMNMTISKENSLDYNEKINFNLFDYYCLKKISNKKNEISLFDLGISLYKKRMDIINVFTFLLLIEKNILYENPELNSYFKALE